jgi:uncharacterized protein (TIGR02452 family)
MAEKKGGRRQFLTQLCKEIKSTGRAAMNKSEVYAKAVESGTVLLSLDDPDLVKAHESFKLLDRPTIDVWNMDTIDATKKMVQDYKLEKRPLVLNLASAWIPGGGWEKGSEAQEECMFFQTFLCNHLYPLFRKPPYIKDREFIVSTSVPVIRSSGATNYEPLEAKERWFIDVMTMAAIRFPKLAKGGKAYAKDPDKELMRDKIHCIFLAAKHLGYTSLVLGAIGCGAYANPREEILELFQEALDLYGSGFQHIVFAVFDKTPDKSSNFSVFSEKFAKK